MANCHFIYLNLKVRVNGTFEKPIPGETDTYGAEAERLKDEDRRKTISHLVDQKLINENLNLMELLKTPWQRKASDFHTCLPTTLKIPVPLPCLPGFFRKRESLNLPIAYG